MSRQLLLFLGAEPGWFRIAEGRVVARGAGLADVRPLDPAEEPEEVVLVVPGCDVAIHWADLPPDLAPAQARGAARLLAAEVSAAPIDSQHIALGAPEEGRAERCMVLVAEERMRDWLAEADALGFDPHRVIPEPLLLLPPGEEEEGVRVLKRAGLDNVRGELRAFAAEPEIAALLLSYDPVETVDAETFERELPEALAAAPVDLRQGGFARKRRWKLDWAHIRRLAVITAGILLVTLLIQLVMIAHYSFAADAVERETIELARDAIPGNVEIADPEAQLAEQLRATGGGPGYGAIAGAVFSAVRATAGAEMQSLVYGSDDAMQISVAAPGAPELTAFHQRLTEAGLSVEAGAVRDGGGRQIGEFTVRAP